MLKGGMVAPIIIFGLVLIVIVWELGRGANSAGSPTVPIWMVVLGSVSLLVSMVGGAFIIAYRNRRAAPTQSSDKSKQERG